MLSVEDHSLSPRSLKKFHIKNYQKLLDPNIVKALELKKYIFTTPFDHQIKIKGSQITENLRKNADKF